MSLFAAGLKGPCPICGAPERACQGGPVSADAALAGAIGAGFFLSGTRAAATEGRWRSRECVYGKDAKTGLDIQVYGIGTPIPLVEALRQGVARWEDLDAADVAALARHGVTNPATQSQPAPIPLAANPQQEPPPRPEPARRPAAAKREGKTKGKGPDRPEKDKMVREGQVVRK